VAVEVEEEEKRWMKKGRKVVLALSGEAWRKDGKTCEMNGDGIEIVEMDAY
jgi:hypothetical protein